MLVVQSDHYNESRLATVVIAGITSRTALAAMPGNVFLPSTVTGLPRDSVVNVTALAAVDRRELGDVAGTLPGNLVSAVDDGLRRVLGL